MRTLIVNVITATLSITLGACSAFNPKVDMPEQTTVKQTPPAPVGMSTPTGSLYSPTSFRPMFEDQRARYVGDVLIVQIQEKINSEQTNSVEASRDDSTSLTLPSIPGFFLGRSDLKSVDKTASGSKDFSGSGQSKAANTLTGTITVTVSDVLPNGNLRVVGEKQIGTNREVESIKFSGVVNPTTIQPGNTVNSTQVADARIEYKGQGMVDAATSMGWLSRFFLTVLPF
jgi:flagellar L-ring protein precursor FlgH